MKESLARRYGYMCEIEGCDEVADRIAYHSKEYPHLDYKMGSIKKPIFMCENCWMNGKYPTLILGGIENDNYIAFRILSNLKIPTIIGFYASTKNRPENDLATKEWRERLKHIRRLESL